jgi:hypothetical protein
MQTIPEPDPLDLCESVAELILVGDRLCGREVVKFMVENIDPERESLMRAVRELKRGKAPPDLIEMVQAAARNAPRSKRKTFSDMAKRRRKAP